MLLTYCCSVATGWCAADAPRWRAAPPRPVSATLRPACRHGRAPRAGGERAGRPSGPGRAESRAKTCGLRRRILAVMLGGDVVDVKSPALLGDHGVEEHLEQHVAELLAHLRPGVPCSIASTELVGLLEQVGHERGVGLLGLPRALGPQPAASPRGTPASAVAARTARPSRHRSAAGLAGRARPSTIGLLLLGAAGGPAGLGDGADHGGPRRSPTTEVSSASATSRPSSSMVDAVDRVESPTVVVAQPLRQLPRSRAGRRPAAGSGRLEHLRPGGRLGRRRLVDADCAVDRVLDRRDLSRSVWRSVAPANSSSRMALDARRSGTAGDVEVVLGDPPAPPRTAARSLESTWVTRWRVREPLAAGLVGAGSRTHVVGDVVDLLGVDPLVADLGGDAGARKSRAADADSRRVRGRRPRARPRTAVTRTTATTPSGRDGVDHARAPIQAGRRRSIGLPPRPAVIGRGTSIGARRRP